MLSVYELKNVVVFSVRVLIGANLGDNSTMFEV